MKTLCIFLPLTLLVTISSANGLSIANCVKNVGQCIRSSECCSGCCTDSKCVPFHDQCIKDSNPGTGKGGPCELLDPPCPAGKVCVLREVQCIRAPCLPIPVCIPEDYQDY